MSEYDKLFTLDSANALLPQIRRLLGEILIFRSKMSEITSSKLQIAAGNGHGLKSEEETQRDLASVVSSAIDIRSLVDAIEETGALVKDIDTGLVDFPSIREGRVVFLCWKMGEDKIRYWHETDAGFADRQEL